MAVNQSLLPRLEAAKGIINHAAKELLVHTCPRWPAPLACP
jgi:hypothetical protein